MKTHEITTSKGEFLLVDDDGKFPRDFPHDFYHKIGYVNNLSEEDAKGVLGSFNTSRYGNYLPTWKLRLEALLKSKGIDINNGNWYLFEKI